MERVIHILLVEDDELEQIEVRRVLERRKILHKLSIAKNGEEAIRMMESWSGNGVGTPDIILLDLNMPKMNGFEFLEIIRSTPHWKDSKVFIVSTSDDQSDKMKAASYNVSGFITKPLKLDHASSVDAFNLMIDMINLQQDSTKIV